MPKITQKPPIPTLRKVVKELSTKTKLSDKELSHIIQPILEKHNKNTTKEIVDALLLVLNNERT